MGNWEDRIISLEYEKFFEYTLITRSTFNYIVEIVGVKI